MSASSETGEAFVRSASVVMPVGNDSVGGDFQVVRSVGSCTIVFVGDITGNGGEAAPYANQLCATLEQILDKADPVELLEALNTRIYNDPDFDRFATGCAVVIDRVSWSARWAFAGHLPPHWLDTGLPLDGATPGLPLGVAESCRATSAERRPLRPGEGMLVFTDGLEDVQGPGGDRFGAARITHTLARTLTGASPDHVVRRLKEIACDFGQDQLPDDLCLVALRATLASS
jgi:serine phosphatase RsbU (regulator of sigma subunit)